MQGYSFDEVEFFRAIVSRGVRALLIGRRALIVLGLPVMTGDYDFWIHPDDASLFNEASAGFDLFPNRSPDEARKVGRYRLENDEKVDVIVARSVPTIDGIRVVFDDVWERRATIPVAPGVDVALPALDDLILTKRFAGRPKDAEDIRMLEALRSQGVP
jgi:hypothetical protein